MAKNRTVQGASRSQSTPKAVAATEDIAISGKITFFENNRMLLGTLVVAVLLAFIGGFGNDFVQWDDNFYVTGNPLIQHPTWANLVEIFRVECAYNFHPLTMVSLWLNSALFGTAATSFIVTNSLLHIVNTLLVFFLAGKLAKGDKVVAFFTALLWGIHPMHTESVTWVSERKDVLYALFFFAACLQYVRFLELGKSKYWVYTMVLFILSCLAKGMAVVLPAVLMLIDYWYDRKPLLRQQLIQKVPFFIVALIFGMLTIHVQSGGDLGGLIHRLTDSSESAIKAGLTVGQRFCFGFYAFCIYIGKFFLPVHQHNFYSYPPSGEYNDPQYIAAPVVALALLVFAGLQHKKNKLLFFGVFYFFCTIVTVLQFISVGNAVVAERYTYIPYFGLVFMLVYWLRKNTDRKKMNLGLGAVSIMFIFLTSLQTQTYKHTESLFLNSWKYEPKSNTVSEVLGDFYGQKGQFQKALNLGEAAINNGVNSWRLVEILSKAYYFTGNVKMAVATWEKGMSGVPNEHKSAMYGERGMMLRAAGMYVKSIHDFEEALSYARYRGDKDSKEFKSSMLYEKGVSNKFAGNYEQAIADFDKVIAVNGGTADSVLREKAVCRLMARDWDAAIKDYSQLISRGSYKDTAYHNRGCARFKLGQRDSAILDLKEALRINPNYSDAKRNLAIMQQ